MIQKERKSKIDFLQEIGQELDNRYQRTTFGNRVCYISKSGIIFNPFAFPGEYALAIEYAESPEAAAQGVFEDGDRFYLDGKSTTDVLNAMMKEIEG